MCANMFLAVWVAFLLGFGVGFAINLRTEQDRKKDLADFERRLLESAAGKK